MDRQTPLRMVKVWDAPVRFFHWAIVLLVGFSWISIEMSWMRLHFLSGYTILTLLIFRIVWGVIGSDTARFSGFLGSPAAAFRHLAHFRRREPDVEVGHNAAGGWMVLLLLLLLVVQAGSGLFANDDVMNEGPLAHMAGKALSDRLTEVHGVTFTLIQIAVVLHVLTVLAYAVLKRQNLVRPMVTGSKRLPATIPAPRLRGPWTALSVLGAAALAVVLLVNIAGR